MNLISIANAQTATGGQFTGESGLANFIPLIIIFLIFYFLIIRPQQKKFNDHKAMCSAAKKGDKIITGGGIYGKITKTSDADDTAEVEIADGIRVKIQKQSISDVLDKKPANNDNKKKAK